MSKKINFTSISAETVNKLNELSKLIFVSAEESKKLSADMTAAKDELAKALEAGTKTAEHDNAVRRVQYKQKAFASLRRITLFNHKDENGVEIPGLYTQLGIDSELYTAYITMQDEGKRGAYLNACKSILRAMGMDTADKLVQALAGALSVSVGRVKSSREATRKGTLTKNVSSSSFQETFTLRLLEQVAKTCDDVIVYSAEFYKGSVEYDKDLKTVLSYTVTEKEVEA